MRVLAVVTALALFVPGCTKRETSPEVQPQPPAASGTAPAAIGDLSAVLFNDVPLDYIAVPEETKSLTLREAAAGSDDAAAEEKRLAEHGFVRGYSRSWTTQSGSGDVILAFVYEFATADGAAADAESGRAEAQADGDAFFDVPAVEGAIGVTKPGKAGEGDFQAVFFVRGPRLYLVAAGGPGKPTPDDARSLAAKMNEDAR